MGVPPGKDMGTVEVLWDGNGVNPPPPPNRHTPVKTQPPVVLRTRAVNTHSNIWDVKI